MVIALKQPQLAGVGGCIACCWQKDSVVPLKLTIFDTYGVGAFIAAIFNGGSKVGSSCPGTDTYVALSPGSQSSIVVDVWAAYRAGAWSSSVTIQVYLWSPGVSQFVEAIALGSLGSCPSTFKGHGVISGSGCPTTLAATVTVFDDGTYTIA